MSNDDKVPLLKGPNAKQLHETHNIVSPPIRFPSASTSALGGGGARSNGDVFGLEVGNGAFGSDYRPARRREDDLEMGKREGIPKFTWPFFWS